MKSEIDKFLREKLNLELHPEKSKIISLSRGIDFVGFRIFYYFKLIRKRNIRKILLRIEQYNNQEITYEKLLDCFKGWQAYAKWADTYKLRKRILGNIEKIDILPRQRTDGVDVKWK